MAARTAAEEVMGRSIFYIIGVVVVAGLVLSYIF